MENTNLFGFHLCIKTLEFPSAEQERAHKAAATTLSGEDGDGLKEGFQCLPVVLHVLIRGASRKSNPRCLEAESETEGSPGLYVTPGPNLLALCKDLAAGGCFCQPSLPSSSSSSYCSLDLPKYHAVIGPVFPVSID